MIKTLQNALKVPEIRKRLLFTLLMMLVVRFGSLLPVPGTNGEYLKNLIASNGEFGFFDALTGGSFTSFSLLALNITPYITSSIIMQLLTIAIPKLEEMQKEGEDGRKKIAKITRYVTVGLALIQSIAMSIGFGSQGALVNYTWYNVCIVVIALTAGSAFLMWIGERITEKGVGNGISIVLLINILSRVPYDFTTLYEAFVKDKNVARAVVSVIIILAIIIAMVAMVVYLNAGKRNIPVQYAKKVQGRRQIGGNSSSIPLKVNTSGVIPVIFASSLMSTPVIICSFFDIRSNVGNRILQILSHSNWFNTANWFPTIGAVIYIALIIGFAYFYTTITFNPTEIANNMKKQGGFIPGIRPGKPTSDFLQRILNYIVFIGAVGLCFVAMIPIVLCGLFSLGSISFGGTTLIIIVGVILETLEKIESMMLVRNYKGFLNE